VCASSASSTIIEGCTCNPYSLGMMTMLLLMTTRVLLLMLRLPLLKLEKRIFFC